MNPIEIAGLTKHYGRFPALRDLNLQVHPGEVFGFLGPNGAGKSTTIRLLLGELRPTSGAALVLGGSPRAVGHRSRLGYVPADLSLWPGMTGAQTIAFFAKLRGGVDQRRIDELAERLDADLSKRVGELSSGNRQKVGLIAAFVHRPELLILDEPNAGLDPLIQHEFQAMMRQVADEGRTVFLSSHTLSEVERVADRVGIIRRGELIAVEEVAQLRSKRTRHIEFDVDRALNPEGLAIVPGARDIVVHERRVELNFDGELGALLAAVSAQARINDIHTSEAELEDIFLTYYKDQS